MSFFSSSLTHHFPLAFSTSTSSLLPPRAYSQRSPQPPPPVPPIAVPATAPAANKKSVWVNPNSRLASLASSLASTPADLIPSLLSSVSPPLSDPDFPSLLVRLSSADLIPPLLHHFLRLSPAPVPLFTLALRRAASLRDWPTAESLLVDLLRRGLTPDSSIVTFAVSCALSSGLPDSAAHWLHRLADLGAAPAATTFSSLLRALASSSRLDLAVPLYDRARSLRLPLEPTAFLALMRLYILSGKLESALSIFEESKALGVPPSLSTYNTLIAALGRAMLPDQVKALFSEMSAAGISPNHRTYHALLHAYSRACFNGDALRVYHLMKEQGMNIDLRLYNCLIRMCTTMGLVEEALEVFNDLSRSSSGCAPDLLTFSSLLSMHASRGSVLEAEAVLKRIVAAGIVPDIVVMTSMIRCYGRAGRTKNVVESFEQVIQLEIAPDEQFYCCLLDVMTRVPREELWELVRCVEKVNERLGSFVRALVDDRDGRSSELFLPEAESILLGVSERARKAYCNCLLDLCNNLDLVERANVLLDLGVRLQVYDQLQLRSAAQWSLELKSLSVGAASVALQAWMNDLWRVIECGEELPPMLGIRTGHGRHKYADGGLASVVQAKLKDMAAPFEDSKGDGGWFTASRVDVEEWLHDMNNI